MKKFRILGWPFDRVFQTGRTPQASQAVRLARPKKNFLPEFGEKLAWLA